MEINRRLAKYVPIQLDVDLERLDPVEARMLPLLIEAAQAMELPFWVQNYGDPQELLASLRDPTQRRFVELNYGPWDRMAKNQPFVSGIGEKPLGANFYPADITREEFEAATPENPQLASPYTMVRRDESGRLQSIPYSQFFSKESQLAAEKLRQAAALAQDPGFKNFLQLRAAALLDDDYSPSDFAWVDLKENTLDILIGPLEVEDRLFGIKTAHAATVLVKDREWSARLSRYIELLPRFQSLLPLPDGDSIESPGLESDLGVYDVAFFAGNDRAAVPLGVSWPNDEQVQMQKGTRSLLLRNVMQANFEEILVPLARLLIAEEQHPEVTFFGNFTFILLHELAHGLGIKETLTGRGTVRSALKDWQHAVEEGKADLLAFRMAQQLQAWGLLSEDELRQIHVTGLLRLLYNYDGPQSIARLNYFTERGAYSRDPRTGTYRVHPEKVEQAVNSLAAEILGLQASGDYQAAGAFFERYGQQDPDLISDIQRIEAASLPLSLVIQDPSA